VLLAACGGELRVDAVPEDSGAVRVVHVGSMGSAKRPARYRVEAGPRSSASAPGGEPDAGSDDAACHKGRRILVDEILNARDLGGVPLRDAERVGCGALFRGPPLAALTSAGCAEFAELGIRTVIDLRIDSESSAVPETVCVERQANLIRAPMPVPYDVSAAAYIADLDTTASVAAAFRALGDASAYPIYFHCTWGRDRTGVLGAVILLALGATRADILQEYLLSRGTVGAYPASLEAMLDEIERRGGIERYLSSAGITPEQVNALRAQVVVH
jgi:protein tyrosine phosphatase (PTP) superfamily phosphohydrolase (DUF442 family)